MTNPAQSTPDATRVAVLVDSISRQSGGLQSSVRRLMQSLHSRPTQVKVCSILDDHSEQDIAMWNPVEVSLERHKGPRLFGFAPKLLDAVSRFSPHIVHTHGLWTFTSVASSVWNRRSGRPVVIHPHGMLDPWALKNSGWKKQLALLAFERQHLRNAACIRALCESEKESIRKLGLTNPVCVIPNGIDLPEGGSTGQPLPSERRRKKLLYLGRIHPKKGLPQLIRAWAGIQNEPEMASWQLQIAGWDQRGHENSLQDLAINLGMQWSQCAPRSASETNSSTAPLVFTGPRFGKDKDALYAACDAFILPSLSEGLPMVVLEAWAHAKPTLITPMCNLPEGPEAGAALEIQPTAESIRHGILELVRMSPERRAEIGQRGLDLVRERFTWSTIAGQLAEVNDWLIHGGDCPPHVHL